MNGGSDGRLKIDTDVADAAGGETDEEATAAAERAAEEAGRIFERILAAHGGAEDPPLGRVLDAAGVRGSRPEGVPLVEAIVRPLGFGAAAPDSSVNERLVPYGAMTATFYTGLGCLVGPSLMYALFRGLVG
jgi:hypothetical protein